METVGRTTRRRSDAGARAQRWPRITVGLLVVALTVGCGERHALAGDATKAGEAAPIGSSTSSGLVGISAAVLAAVAAVLGAGGGFRILVEPMLRRRHVRKTLATGLWLSCHELGLHLAAIRDKLAQDNADSEKSRDALLKIPRHDYKGRADWFVKTGYFTMITAYKISAAAAWMRIYQAAALQATIMIRRDKFVLDLFKHFDAFKNAASENTVLWYSYIDAIGEKMIKKEGDYSFPMPFNEFCKRYFEEAEFLMFFDQVHMFIHFIGKRDPKWSPRHKEALAEMIKVLGQICAFIDEQGENLLLGFTTKPRTRAPAPELIEQ
jgi:hypothetical protein